MTSRAALHLATLLALTAPGAAPAQEISGMVWDEDRGNPIPGASVQLLNGAYTTVDSTRSSATGQFRFRVPDTETLYYLAVSHDGFNAIVETVQAPLQNVLLSLRPVEPGIDVRRARWDSILATDPAEANPLAADLIGEVRGRENERPIEAAEARLVELGISATSDKNGYFSFRNVPAGRHTLEVSHLSFTTSRREFVVDPGFAYTVDVALSVEPVELAGIEVTVQQRQWARQLETVRTRMARGMGGTYISRAEFERKGKPPLSMIMRGLAGVEMNRASPVGQDYFVQFRGCRGTPAVVIDGVMIQRGSWSLEPIELDLVPTTDIEVVEIHKSLATLPPEYATPDTRCGVIAIWTRHHEPARRGRDAPPAGR